jgi:hypothetical protein
MPNDDKEVKAAGVTFANMRAAVTQLRDLCNETLREIDVAEEAVGKLLTSGHEAIPTLQRRFETILDVAMTAKDEEVQ